MQPKTRSKVSESHKIRSSKYTRRINSVSKDDAARGSAAKPERQWGARAFTLYYDNDAGELAKVVASGRFQRESPLMQADVLKDALEALGALYAHASGEAFKAWSAPKGNRHV